jgi:hypothetical protein
MTYQSKPNPLAIRKTRYCQNHLQFEPNITESASLKPLNAPPSGYKLLSLD